MQNTIKVTIAIVDASVSDLLIAQLSEMGFDGFEEEVDNLSAFCNEDIFDESALTNLLNEYKLTYDKTVIPPQNWNELWESNFHPVVVDGFAGVRASFHTPLQGVEHEIIITPKMSFGTGHHATTYMMMQQMQHLNFNDKDIFDFGTGTGILAILAKMLRAKNVTAIDLDEWSITNAWENFDNNNIQGVKLLRAENPGLIEQTFDIILANINKNVLLEFIPVLATKLNKGAYLLLSGLLADDEPAILLKTAEGLLTHVSTITRSGWICMLLQA